MAILGETANRNQFEIFHKKCFYCPILYFVLINAPSLLVQYITVKLKGFQQSLLSSSGSCSRLNELQFPIPANGDLILKTAAARKQLPVSGNFFWTIFKISLPHQILLDIIQQTCFTFNLTFRSLQLIDKKWPTERTYFLKTSSIKKKDTNIFTSSCISYSSHSQEALMIKAKNNKKRPKKVEKGKGSD